MTIGFKLSQAFRGTFSRDGREMEEESERGLQVKRREGLSYTRSCLCLKAPAPHDGDKDWNQERGGQRRRRRRRRFVVVAMSESQASKAFVPSVTFDLSSHLECRIQRSRDV